MIYRKQIVDNIEKCYAVTQMIFKGEPCLVASGEKTAPCRIYSLAGKRRSQIWDSPGGVMTMVPVPAVENALLATQEFFSPDDSQQAGLICARYRGQGWDIERICDLPWVHRFDLFRRSDTTHILACTLKSGHEYEGDFRRPGRLFTGTLAPDPAAPLSLSVWKEGLTRNHGYTRLASEAEEGGIVSCDKGVFQIAPPERPEDEWTLSPLLSSAASDAVKLDLDGDGLPELLTISPFHGDTVQIWHLVSGAYQPVYELPEKLPFSHAITGGIVNGRPMIFVGNREGGRYLLGFYFDRHRGEYRYDLLDRNTGAANCLLFERDGHAALFVTNREIDEVAIYDILPDENT